jgi:hypothetical protein
MGQAGETKLGKWARVVADWQESGDTQRGYCLSRGLSYEKFKYWRKQVDGLRGEGGLVKVGAGKDLPWSSYGGTVARCGAVRIELSGEESERQLGRIFRALGRVGCS